ncbi:MAG: hypothetical protein KJ754_08270, partial [Bacteroidetes bacterium]|nr:hypothetical protein [Bacteroidota bacterium]MBU2464801.1 hypothetical protein [Bacteroidota bacterium]
MNNAPNCASLLTVILAKNPGSTISMKKIFQNIKSGKSHIIKTIVWLPLFRTVILPEHTQV